MCASMHASERGQGFSCCCCAGVVVLDQHYVTTEWPMWELRLMMEDLRAQVGSL